MMISLFLLVVASNKQEFKWEGVKESTGKLVNWQLLSKWGFI